jgi:hypothetical protein
MKRRDFLKTAATVAALPLLSRVSKAQDIETAKVPFRTLYNNDCTNLLSCPSPWHAAHAPFSDALIDASVAEVSGLADAQFFSPGLGWVPWWKSQIYPAPAHYQWFAQRTGQPIDSLGQYMIQGGDVVTAFVNACHTRRQWAFISYRLNDIQHLETIGQNSRLESLIPKIYYDHPEYKIGPDTKPMKEMAHNWAIPEARNYKLGLIEEICLNYSIDGIELDFQRFPSFFTDQTNLGQRRTIMVDAIKQVRMALNRGAATFKQPRRYMSVRVPSRTDYYDHLGIDLPAFVEAGVDMINVSASYFTEDDTDLSQIRALVPNTAVYLEATHTTNVGASKKNYDGSNFLRTTDQQFYTSANIAYHQGANGMSLFNLAYYRGVGDANGGPYNEPPFHIIKQLADPAFVAAQPQWYVLAKDVNTLVSPRMQMPKALNANEPYSFTLPMYPRAGHLDGILRVRTVDPSSEASVAQAWINDHPLTPVAYVAKPLPHPYDANLDVDAARFSCFEIKNAPLKSGSNTIKILMASSKQTIDYLDVALP